MATEQVNIPAFPVIAGALAEVPESVKKAWRETYLKAHRQSELDSPLQPGAHPQVARKAANALLQVNKPTSYEEAMDLPDWQVMKRQEKEGQLILVTIDGRGPDVSDPEEARPSKFIFDIPVRKQKASAAAAVPPDDDKGKGKT
jgi:hypothetical protein